MQFKPDRYSEVSYVIIYCLNCIWCDGNLISKKGLRSFAGVTENVCTGQAEKCFTVVVIELAQIRIDQQVLRCIKSLRFFSVVPHQAAMAKVILMESSPRTEGMQLH